jgi:hypothetical protein
VWNGYLSALGFQFWSDSHFCHLANIATTDYNVYRAAEWPHWERAEVYGSEYVLPGEFLIYRPSDFGDDDCLGISTLVCRLHASIAASSELELPIPSHYILDGM